MPDPIEEITKIAEDLVKIEVNLILSSTINAQKMPKPRHALIDIGKEYYAKLEEYGCLDTGLYEGDKDAAGKIEDITQLVRLDDEGRLGSCDAFSYMRQVANYKIQKIGLKLEDLEELGALNDQQEAEQGKLTTELAMLSRIKDKSDQIKGIFNANCIRHKSFEGRKPKTTAVCSEIPDSDPDKKFLTNLLDRIEIEINQDKPLVLGTDELALLRKIWEIGTSEIAMQTVVQLDGDVVTRIQSKYASPDFTTLHQLHHKGVNTALEFWKDLIALVKDFFENIVQFVFQRRS